jgi:hypothetical protein
VRAGPSGGVEPEFSQPTGDWLLHLGFIERTPDSVPVGYRDFSVPFVLRRFEPTGKALKLVAVWEAREGRSALRATVARCQVPWGQQAGADVTLAGAP